MVAQHLTIVHYPPHQQWRCVEVRVPAWEVVSSAIQRMDDNECPIVLLSWKDVASGFDDEESFNLIGGGSSGFALFEQVPGWMFEDPLGGDEDVRLWQSDQGYFCKRKNVLADVNIVLKLARVYFDTGSYEEVRSVALAVTDRP